MITGASIYAPLATPLYMAECRGATTSSKLGGPIPWSMVLLPFYRKKLDRSTQFGAVGYVITLYSSKSNVKNWGQDPPTPQWMRPWRTVDVMLAIFNTPFIWFLPRDGYAVAVLPFEILTSRPSIASRVL